MSIPKVRTEVSDNNRRRGRQPAITENSVGKRIVEALGDRPRTWLAAQAELPDSTIGDAIKRGVSRADVAVKLSRALGVSLDWLLTGAAKKKTGFDLRPVEDADWVDVPEYDLREMGDDTLGAALTSISMRKDWLSATFRVSSGLWLTHLTSSYEPAGLSEGALVVCRSVDLPDLSEGHVCIWRFHTSLVVGRFSVVPDALASSRLDGIGGRYAAAADVVISPSQVGEGPDQYRLIGRVMGVLLRQL